MLRPRDVLARTLGLPPMDDSLRDAFAGASPVARYLEVDGCSYIMDIDLETGAVVVQAFDADLSAWSGCLDTNRWDEI